MTEPWLSGETFAVRNARQLQKDRRALIEIAGLSAVFALGAILLSLLLLAGCATPRYNGGYCSVNSRLLGEC